MTNQQLIAMAEGLRREHFYLEEDCYYSCPMTREEDYCGDLPRDSCTCGADEHNAKVDALVDALRARFHITSTTQRNNADESEVSA